MIKIITNSTSAVLLFAFLRHCNFSPVFVITADMGRYEWNNATARTRQKVNTVDSEFEAAKKKFKKFFLFS